MFLLYLKSYRKIFIAFIIVSIIFTSVFSLYNLEVEAVLYSSALSLIFLLIFISFDYLNFYRKHKSLEYLLNNININLSNLPKTHNTIEEDYQKLIRSLYDYNKDLAFQFDSDKSELLDYYTLWAHQIKTPISAMKLLLESNDYPKTSDLSIELFKIEQYVEMVLQYLRIDSISTDFSFKESDLDSIIKSSIRKYSKIFIGKKISLNYTETSIKVLTDKKWLQFVIEQLLSNALKYTSKGKISIYMEGDNLLVIKDTGIGISPEDLPRIFEKGFTGYNGRTNRKSTGIGLYLCKKILNKLSHTIEIESEVGRGTTAKIDFSTDELIIE